MLQILTTSFIVILCCLFFIAGLYFNKDIIIDFRKHKKHVRGEPRIVCAAARNSEGEIIISIRHYDSVFHQTVRMMTLDKQAFWEQNVEQGFIDQFGKFYTREEAWIVAEAQEQIIARCGGDGVKLYSENLY